MNKAKSRSNLNLNKCIYAIINDQMEFRIGLVGSREMERQGESERRR